MILSLVIRKSITKNEKIKKSQFYHFLVGQFSITRANDRDVLGNLLVVTNVSMSRLGPRPFPRIVGPTKSRPMILGNDLVVAVDHPQPLGHRQLATTGHQQPANHLRLSLTAVDNRQPPPVDFSANFRPNFGKTPGDHQSPPLPATFRQNPVFRSELRFTIRDPFRDPIIISGSD